MKSTRWNAGLVIAASLTLSLGALGDGSWKVLQLAPSLSGVAQDDQNGMLTVQKIKIGANQLINLALGRDPDATPAPNEVLALAGECGGSDMRMIVFDKNTSSALATIAVATELSVVTSSKGAQFVLVMAVQDVGGVNNGFNGGTLMLSGVSTTDPSLCVTKATATVMGALNVTFTDDLGTQTTDVLIPKGKMATGVLLGTLSE